MALASDAKQLAAALQVIVKTLEQYLHAHGAELVRRSAKALRPLMDAFDVSLEQRDRENAAALLEQITPLVRDIGAAASKGEMPIFPEGDRSMTIYGELHSICRERRYHHDTL